MSTIPGITPEELFNGIKTTCRTIPFVLKKSLPPIAGAVIGVAIGSIGTNALYNHFFSTKTVEPLEIPTINPIPSEEPSATTASEEPSATTASEEPSATTASEEPSATTASEEPTTIVSTQVPSEEPSTTTTSEQPASAPLVVKKGAIKALQAGLGILFAASVAASAYGVYKEGSEVKAAVDKGMFFVDLKLNDGVVPMSNQETIAGQVPDFSAFPMIRKFPVPVSLESITKGLILPGSLSIPSCLKLLARITLSAIR